MTAAQILQAETTTAAVALIVSGFISVTMRRHVVLNLLGVSLAILGSALLLCDPLPGRGRWTASIVVINAALLAPIGFAAMARWRLVRGSPSRMTLQDVDEEERRA
jgi:hypothetical protein